MGLADLLGIADLHCGKVESTKWLKHKLEASSLNKPTADLGFLFEIEIPMITTCFSAQSR